MIRKLLIPGALAALIVGPPLVSADRLPDPIATHWGLGGEPDSSMPLIVFVAVLGGLWAIAWAVIALVRAGTSRPIYATLIGTGSLFAVVSVSVVQLNLDRTDWRNADPIGWWVVLGVLALLFGAAAGWLLGRDEATTEERSGDTIDPSGRVWVGTASSRWPVGAAILALIPLLFFDWPVWPVFMVIALGILVFTRVTVTAGEHGVSVAMGPFRWRWWRLVRGDIAGAAALDVRPMRFGGWGLRIIPKATAVVIRAGSAVEISRPGKRALVVTVDDAETGAAFIRGIAGS